MVRNIYLIGVNHEVQHRNPNSMYPEKERVLEDFSLYINTKVQELSVTMLAEEFSQDACRISLVDSSVVQDISIQLGLKHLFCDPNIETRKLLHIETNDINRREDYWKKQLVEFSSAEEKIIMVIGINHMKSFCKKLKKTKNIICEILEKTWGDENGLIYCQ